MRLDKFITSDGRMSRREAAGIIRRGLVTVNGETVRQADFRVDPEADAVAADGRRILWRRNTYIMLNKPAGFVSSTEKGKTVMTLLGDEEGRPGLFPCGRLDADTEGLLLVTDDGPLGHLLLSPRRHVEKEYFFECDPPLTAEGFDILRSGPDLGDFTARPARTESIDGGAAGRIAVTEGKYHQIKRMVHAAGQGRRLVEAVRGLDGKPGALSRRDRRDPGSGAPEGNAVRHVDGRGACRAGQPFLAGT